jgi:hypothetical protein
MLWENEAFLIIKHACFLKMDRGSEANLYYLSSQILVCVIRITSMNKSFLIISSGVIVRTNYNGNCINFNFFGDVFGSSNLICT